MSEHRHHFEFVRWLGDAWERPNTNEAWYYNNDKMREALYQCAECGKELRKWVAV